MIHLFHCMACWAGRNIRRAAAPAGRPGGAQAASGRPGNNGISKSHGKRPEPGRRVCKLGAAYMEKRDYGGAIPSLKRALELSPDLPVAHQLIGYALLSQGFSAEAIPHLQRVGRWMLSHRAD